MTIRHGEILLGCIRTVRGEDGAEREVPSSELPCNKLAHVTAVERLLVQLEETQTNFDDFWLHHDHKLQQCLLLRRFEEDFRQVQFSVEKHIAALSLQTELGESPEGATQLLEELRQFEANTMDDIRQAEKVRSDGDRFIEEDHYAVDCIRPKCLELQRICEQYKELLRKRQELLAKSRELQDRIQRASQWCSKGVDLMSTQNLDQNSPLEAVNAALRDLEAFMESEVDLGLTNAEQVKVIYDDIISPEIKVALEQVLQRMEDVHTMCDQKRQVLRKLVERPPRPVQTVHPEPHSGSTDDLSRDNKARRSGHGQIDRTKTQVEVIHPEWDIPQYPKALDSDSDSGSPKDESARLSTIQAKAKRRRKMQRHVMRELIETEKLYVSELREVLTGYYEKMESSDFEDLLPTELCGRQKTVFGNMPEICDFHENIFLKELEACKDTPAMVGKCFVRRTEEFQMYSYYCQNKVDSDSLRQAAHEDNAFFKECQKRLLHKLPLGAYLLKPVQRVTKYQLLLKEMLKYTQNDPGTPDLEEALLGMLSVLKHVNDIMHQVAITGFDGLASAGRLLMQGSFSVWRENRRDRIRDLRFKSMQRHIFLYNKLILFCKRKEDQDRADKDSYIYKHSLEMAQVGLTETVRGDRKKFEIWLRGRTEVYTIQAPSMEVKTKWIEEIKNVLLNQFDQIKESTKKVKAVLISPVNATFLSQEPAGAITHPESQTLPNSSNSSPKTIHKSYSTDSYTAPAGMRKSFSTDATLTSQATLTTDASVTSDLGHDTEEDGWFSEEEGEAGIGDTRSSHSPVNNLDLQDVAYSQRYVALASYQATEASESSLQEGDMVEILQIGNKGWWFVRNLSTLDEGWTPASFLDCAKRSSTYSTQSTISSGSTDSGGRRGSGVTLGNTSGVSTVTSLNSIASSSGNRHSISSQGTSTSGVSTQSSATTGSAHKTIISETLV